MNSDYVIIISYGIAILGGLIAIAKRPREDRGSEWVKDVVEAR